MNNMSKELEALYRLATRNSGNHRSIEEVDKDFKIIEKALKDYEAIDNAEPSKALECLDKLEECAEGMKDLPKSNWIDLAETEAELDLKIMEWVETIKFELFKGKQALLKAQEPKQYLKWEDLEFNIEKQMMTVLLNGTKYTLILGRNVHIDKLAFLKNGEINYYFLEADKQFFNDLHLERVEE